MAPEELVPGDRVRVVIEGTVGESSVPDVLSVGYQISIPEHDGNWRHASVNMLSDNVTVQRLGPLYWPPRQGDVWVSVDPVLWFCHRHSDGNLRLVNDVGAVLSVGQFRDGYAGRLVLRNGRVPGAVA